MKDLVITSARLKTEAWTALACLLVAIAINAGAIVYYSRPWTELYSMAGYELVIALGLYLLWTLLRIVYKLITALV